MIECEVKLRGSHRLSTDRAGEYFFTSPLLFKWSFGRISNVLSQNDAELLALFPGLCSSDSILFSMIQPGSILCVISQNPSDCWLFPDVPNSQLLQFQVSPVEPGPSM